MLIGFLPPLIDMADSVDVVREAVSWLLSADPGALQMWALLRHTHEQLKKMHDAAAQSVIQSIPPRKAD